MYEIMPPDRIRSVGVGFYDLATRTRREFRLGLTKAHGGIHIGRDPENRRCFFESKNEQGRILTYFPRLEPGKTNADIPLIGAGYTTFSNNQRSHFHPSLTPDRNFILFTGGDARNQTNHLFLVDISDLKDTVIEG
jgi:hypothetical protein